MGVLNVTPDSFSDQVHHSAAPAAIAHGLRLAEEGARILDIGGESSRPGAEPVSAEEEIGRVIPVIEALSRQTRCLISVDTTKAVVADAALRAGAHIVNDISALGDPAMAAVVRAHRAGLVLMHMQGTPRTMQKNPHYDDVVREVAAFLRARLTVAQESGIDVECVALDPGIGFGKTVAHNVSLLSALASLHAVGRPLLIGVSRKHFLGVLTGRPVEDRLLPSLAALAFAALQGAQILRVHDVKESCEMTRLLAILKDGQVPPA